MIFHPGSVRLVDDKHIRYFQDPGFDGLDFIAEAGRFDNESRVCETRDIHFALSCADRFDDNDLEPCRIKHLGQRRGGLGNATQRTAGSHRANEDTFVTGQVAHTDSVTKYCTTSEWTGRVHRDNCNALR